MKAFRSTLVLCALFANYQTIVNQTFAQSQSPEIAEIRDTIGNSTQSQTDEEFSVKNNKREKTLSSSESLDNAPPRYIDPQFSNAYGEGIRFRAEPTGIINTEGVIIDDSIIPSHALIPSEANVCEWSHEGANTSAPLLLLRSQTDRHGNYYQSTTIPKHWAKVTCGAVDLEIVARGSSMPSAVQFLINGEITHPDRFEATSDWIPISESDESQPSSSNRTFTWQCPPLGRFAIQVRYQVDNQWSIASPPIYLEIVGPLAPKVMALGTDSYGLLPVKDGLPVRIAGSKNILVKFADAPTNGTKLLADFEGFGTVAVLQHNPENQIYTFDASSMIPSGRHAVRFRTQDTRGCGMTSSPSETVWIDYQTLNSVKIVNTNGIRRQDSLNALRKQIALYDQHFAVYFQSLLKSIECGLNREVHTNTCDEKSKHQECPCDHHNNKTEKKADSSCICCLMGAQNCGDEPKKDGCCLGPIDSLHAAWHYRRNLTKKAEERLRDIEENEQESMNTLQNEKTISSTIEFDDAAYFPRVGHAVRGNENASDGLVLNEGMKLITHPNGNFEVEYSYSPPPVPVRLVLQLQFRSTKTGDWKTLTLSPVKIDPRTRSDFEGVDAAKAKTLEGYSPALKHEAGAVVEARRRGTAQFGFGFEGFDDRSESY